MGWDDLGVADFGVADHPEIDAWSAGSAIKGTSVPLEIYFVGSED